MTAISYGGETPTVGGDEDTWGSELNTALTEIKADLDMLNTASANSILGRNEGTAGDVERLTATEVAAMLPAVTGDSGSGGTKGLVPAPAAGDAALRKVLLADGTWGSSFIRAFGAFDGTDGSDVGTPFNLSCARSATGVYSLTFDTALASANYAVFVSAQDSAAVVARVSQSTKLTTGFEVRFVGAADGVTAADTLQLYVAVLQL